jgi:CheY-like chemotaxis protein
MLSAEDDAAAAMDDVETPVMNGLDALRHIRALDTDTFESPVAVTSTPAELATGASGLPKPMDVRYVLRSLAT